MKSLARREEMTNRLTASEDDVTPVTLTSVKALSQVQSISTRDYLLFIPVNGTKNVN